MTMAKTKPKSADYKEGYKNGFNAGYTRGRGDATRFDNLAHWIMRKDGWYCSNCGTKNEQKHDDFCCKCGFKMSEEANYEDN